ncbi:MAG: SRPBCC domain-containing protein [Trebonia sp.]
MPAEVVPGKGNAPRRARFLIPTQLPRRGELVAACAVALLIVHLVFAQLTLVLAVVFVVVSRVSRWRPWWLLVPAAAGIVWTLAIGLGSAAHGFAAGPAHLLGYMSAHGLAGLHGVFSGAGAWLPWQAPLALVAASAEAAVAGWLDWLHTDEWALAPPRPGLVALARRAGVTRAIRSGGVVTRDGGSLGVAPATGARVGLSWAEATAGVLFTGAAARDVAATSFQLMHASLRLRKPVIALDLSGDPAVGSALSAACTATGVPLRTFGTGETDSGCYEPFRDGEAARRTELMLALLGGGGVAGGGGGGVAGGGGAQTTLRGVFELIGQVPAGPQVPVLDDVLHLLNPMAMQARLGLVSGASPLAAQITEHVRDAARQVQSDPETTVTVARQLEAVRKSPAGRWLRPGGADHAGIDLGRVVRERSAVLFQVDSPGMARLVCADLLANCAPRVPPVHAAPSPLSPPPAGGHPDEIVLPSGEPTAVVELTRRIPVPVPGVTAILADIDLLARCLPGAELTADLGGDWYEGRARVTLGPVRLSFTGVAHVAERGERRIRVLAQGGDPASGQARADITLTAVGDIPDTVLAASARLYLTGRIASFGRSLTADVAAQMFTEFAAAIERAATGRRPDAVRPAGGLRLMAAILRRRLRSLLGRRRT